MKTKLIFLSLFFIALYSNEAYSQYYGTGGGVDRSIGSGTRQNKSSKNKEKIDFAESATDYLKKELKLDGLQEAAVKSIMNDNKASIDEVSMMNISYEEKRDKMQVINDKINTNIIKILSKEQAEKYLKMQEEREKKALRN